MSGPGNVPRIVPEIVPEIVPGIVPGIFPGIVLAGGRSRRFGGDKALALYQGRPLLAHAVDALRPACTIVAVNAPAEGPVAAYARAAGLPVVPDGEADAQGPLLGVLAGLDWAGSLGADVLATAPCDTPRLPPDLFLRLRAGLGASAAAAAGTPQGLHPLCALWRTGGRAALAALLAAGGHPRMRDVLKGLGAAVVSFDDEGAFANVNTQADLAALDSHGDQADAPPETLRARRRAADDRATEGSKTR